MEASGHTWFSFKQVYFTTESINSVAYELKVNGAKRQTQTEPEKSKIQLRIIDFSITP